MQLHVPCVCRTGSIHYRCEYVCAYLLAPFPTNKSNEWNFLHRNVWKQPLYSTTHTICFSARSGPVLCLLPFAFRLCFAFCARSQTACAFSKWPEQWRFLVCLARAFVCLLRHSITAKISFIHRIEFCVSVSRSVYQHIEGHMQHSEKNKLEKETEKRKNWKTFLLFCLNCCWLGKTRAGACNAI